jgi:hypothetical protein
MDEQRGDVQHEAPAGEVPTPQPQVRVIPPDMSEAPFFYSNMVQVATSPYDFTLHFSWFAPPLVTEPPAEDIQVTARPMASVTIPVTLMGSFLQVLQDQFENWQNRVRQSLPSESSSAQEEVERSQ